MTSSSSVPSLAERFGFGQNWQRFLSHLDDDRVAEAQRSLVQMLDQPRLDGLRFIDVGCGSGLFSLAARRLGASVIAFDFDPNSVAAAQSLRERFDESADNWHIERGDVLDAGYLDSLGTHDVVYSWGVLHHTGAMWRALENVKRLVAGGGRLFIAIYNDQALLSQAWLAVKRAYNANALGRAAVTSLFVPWFALESAALDIARLRSPLASFAEYKKSRGMSKVVDWIDWLGGYPFEVASVAEIASFYEADGFETVEVKPIGRGHGNNEFVFRRVDPRD